MLASGQPEKANTARRYSVAARPMLRSDRVPGVRIADQHDGLRSVQVAKEARPGRESQRFGVERITVPVRRGTC